MLNLVTAAFIGFASLTPVAVAGDGTPTITHISTVSAPTSRLEPSSAIERAAVYRRCDLVRVIKRAGFTGRDVRIAYAVAMRESSGDASQITNGADFGLFQFNRPSWGGSAWWNTSRLLTADYNARQAYRMVQRSGWRPWGLNRSGTAVYARDYAGIWSQWKIDNWIWKPYAYWLNRYPTGCRA